MECATRLTRKFHHLHCDGQNWTKIISVSKIKGNKCSFIINKYLNASKTDLKYGRYCKYKIIPA